jgi:tetratricopeptide (TPR) repeat protein
MADASAEHTRVFISYSHDSPEHEARVLGLADRLRSEGVDANLDQYVAFPPEGWIRWTREQVEAARFVLVICTETYRRRAEGEEESGRGLGITFETGLISQLIYSGGGRNDKFVPVLLSEGDREQIPRVLTQYTYFPVYTDQGYEDLYSLLTNRARKRTRDLGRLRALPAQRIKADYRSLLWNVPPRNPLFIGRQEYLANIHAMLIRSRSDAAVAVCAITGLSGIGKTQIAIEYAYRYRDEYDAVFWCRADSREALASGFAEIANLLDLPEKDDRDRNIAAEAARRWLERQSGWLLILDNADDPAGVVQSFLQAHSSGHVLITTRLRATGDIASVEPDEMRFEEGALFLLRHAQVIPQDGTLDSASSSDKRFALEISRELAGLPLALDQAAAFIQETPSTLAEYLSLYRSEGARLLSRRGGHATDHPSVSATFSLAFARIAEASPAAADLVRVCAFLGPDGIPEEIFTRGGMKLGEALAQIVGERVTWLEAVAEAGKFALIRRNAQDESLDIHPLVQEVVKDGMDAPARRACAEQVVEALNEVFPEVEYRNWAQCNRLLPHAMAASRLIEDLELGFAAAAALLERSAKYLQTLARYAEAEPLYRRALAIRQRSLGPDDPETAGILNSLAVLYASQEKYKEAEPLLQRALAIYEKVLGPDHPHTATSLNSLAELYTGMGRRGEAEALNHRALAIIERVLGPDQPEAAASLNNLAVLYRIMGRYPEAEDLNRRALAIRERVLGPDHPETAASLDNLAVLYGLMARYPEAEALYRGALDMRERALGAGHPETAVSLNNLAVLYTMTGRYPEGEAFAQRALSIRERVLGPNHPETAASLNNLALLYANQGHYPEAEELYQRALAIRERTQGPSHPETAVSLNNLALLYTNQARYPEAERLFLRALEICEQVLGPDQPETGQCLANLAELYSKQSHFDQAEPLLSRALAIRERTLGPEHPDTLASVHALGALYRVLDRYADAERLLKRAIELREKVLGPNVPQTVQSRNELVLVYRDQGRLPEAQELREQAIVMDPLDVAYAAVLERPALYEVLDHLDSDLLVKNILEIYGTTDPAKLPDALRRLHEKRPDAQPNPLWKAWVRGTRADKVKEMERKLAR